MHQARFCVNCGINWPSHPDFTLCPECVKPTTIASKPIGQIMPLTEAKRRLSYALFDEWLQKETHEQRKAREQRVLEGIEEHEEMSQAINARFTEAIRDGGFTEEDTLRYAELEQKLPLAHIHQYVDPDE
jgi:NMD protein affecting ribosome stability and mRNA decay